MLAGKENIDDFFRDRQQSLPVDPASQQKGWKDMDALLGKPAPGPKTRKRITRRLVTYMGLAAIVTTITYFAVTKTKEKNIAKKIVQQKNRQAVPVAKTNSPVVALPPLKYTVTKNIIPKKKQRYQGNVWTKISSVSDTVFQQPVVNPIKISDGSVVQNFYRSLQQPEQFFEISPSRDTLLFGNEGTVIKVPAGSFYNGRKPATGIIKIGLVECYQYIDMLAHALTTTAGDQPLVTGGMIRIRATENGEQVKIFNNNTLSVAMPMDRYDPDMQLFLPATKGVWNTTAKKAIEPALTVPGQKGDTVASSGFIPTVTEMDAGGNGFVQMDWTPAGQQQAYRSYLEYSSRKQVKLFDIRQKMKGMNDTEEGHFIVNAGSRLTDEKIRQLIAYRYFAAGYKKISIERNNDFSKATKAKRTNVSISPEGFMATDSLMMDFKEAWNAKLLTTEDSLHFSLQNRLDSITFFERLKADSIAYVRRIEFNKAYSFNITQLGWLNCDKFMKTEQPMVEFSIPLDPNLQQQHGRYQLVFISRKAVLPGNYANGLVSFGKLPAGEAVQVVCIAEKDGRAVGCIQRTVTGPAAMAALKFEPITPEAFKQKLAKL